MIEISGLMMSGSVEEQTTQIVLREVHNCIPVKCREDAENERGSKKAFSHFMPSQSSMPYPLCC